MTSIRLFFNIILACSLFTAAVALPLNATARSEDAKPNSAPGIEAFIEAINLYKGGQYASAIAEFEAAVAYFEETGQTGQITLAQKYITNAQSLLHEAESQSSGDNDAFNSVAIRVKQAAIPEPDRIAQSTSLVPEAATAITETGQITDTATITLTPESPTEAAPTDDAAAAPTETETASTEDAAAEEEIAEPISLPAILCADTAIDETATPAELIPLATSFVDSGDQLHKEKKFDEAIAAYCSGLVIVAELGDTVATANILAKLAESYKGAELDAETVSAYTSAADLYEAAELFNNAADSLMSLGRHHRSAQRTLESIFIFNRARSIYQDLDDTPNVASVLVLLADAYGKSGQDSDAVEAYEEAVAIYGSTDSLTEQANTLEAFARYESSVERFDSAISYNEEALEIRRSLGEDNRAAAILKQLGDNYRNIDSDQATSAYEEAIELYLSVDDAKSAVNVIEIQGRDALANEEFAEAINYFSEAVDLRQALGDDSATVGSLNQLANAYLKNGDEAQAITTYDEVIALYLQLENPTKAADTAELIARTEAAVERYDNAIARYEQAVEIRRTVGDEVATATTLNQLAKTLQAAGDETAMVAVSEESASLFEAAGETEKAEAALLPTSTPTPTPTPTTFYITPTPNPVDIFEAATRSAEATAEVASFGTPTPLPPNWRVARIGVLPNVSDYENPATAVALSQLATAIAQTTGTPEGWEFRTATPRPSFIYVTPTPQADDIFAAATLSAQMTVDAQAYGTETPLPDNWRVARIGVLPNLSDYENSATAVALSAISTAIFQTTGTPEGVIYQTATPRPTATPQFVASAGVNDILVGISLEQLMPTPMATTTFPQSLIGRILFTSERTSMDLNGKTANVSIFSISPDGTQLQALQPQWNWVYDRVSERDEFAANRQFRAFVRQEHDQARLNQYYVFYDFYTYGTTKQLTFFGDSNAYPYEDAPDGYVDRDKLYGAWDPAWSPTAEKVALVSNTTGNDEIWVVERDVWPGTQLTSDNFGALDRHPSWSPDGNQIVFFSTRSGSRQIWIMNADGTNQRQLTNFVNEAWDPVWVKYGDS